MKYWSKTSLTVYKYLSTMSKTIDKTIMDLGKSSNSVVSQKRYSTYFQASKIIELMDRKRKMINLKVAVEDSMNRLDKLSRRILTLSYMDGAKCETIAKLMGTSLRTYFRKKLSAFNQFTEILCELGYDESFFESEYFGEKWFMAIYDDCVCKGCDSDEAPDRYVVKKLFNELSKINFAYNTYLT